MFVPFLLMARVFVLAKFRKRLLTASDKSLVKVAIPHSLGGYVPMNSISVISSSYYVVRCVDVLNFTT